MGSKFDKRTYFNSYSLMKIIIFITALLLLNGCTMAGLVKISDPQINSPNYTFSSGILELDNIEISVKPQTYKSSFIFGGIILPIIPLGFGNDFNRQEHNLKVILQFEPHDSSFSFSPARTILLKDGKKMSPSNHSKSLTSIRFAREISKAPPGHDWVCNDQAGELLLTKINTTFSLNQKTCVILEYPIITPETDETFNINIEGLQKDNKPVKVPSIHFESGTTGVFTILM